MSTHEKSLRIKLLEAIHQFKIKQIEVAREANVHHSTLSLYLQGKVRPNPRVEQALDQWLQRLQQNPDLKFARNPEAKGLGGDHHGLKPGVARNDFNRVHEVAKRDEEEDLVPVRIDLEFEGRRFRENIIWNANEKNIQADFFARQMAIDNDLPPVFENEIVMVIQKAVQTHRKYVPQQPELLKIIELDLRLENICLKDRFEWDINDPNNVPEDFALLLCNDLGLNHEFVTIIAHSIREQIEGYRKEVIETGGEALANMKKSMRFLIESSQKLMSSSLNKTLETKQITEENYLRQAKPVYYEGDEDGLAYWEPKIEVLDPEDLEKVEKLENRKLRYEKRRR